MYLAYLITHDDDCKTSRTDRQKLFKTEEMANQYIANVIMEVSLQKINRCGGQLHTKLKKYLKTIKTSYEYVVKDKYKYDLQVAKLFMDYHICCPYDYYVEEIELCESLE